MDDNLEKARQTLERIKKMKSAVDTQLFKTDLEEKIEFKVHIDNSLPHGRFFPFESKPNEWKATKQTYSAMKKNIFALGDDIDELKRPYTCESCNTNLDMQFWHFCPYCGQKFRSDL